MRLLLQRVAAASVEIDAMVKASIMKGLLLFVGIEEADSNEDIEWLCGKISRLRIFDDTNHIMNLSITDVGGQILVISQFTLHASVKKGNRPSYLRAAPPAIAVPLYEKFLDVLKSTTGLKVESGVFGADMKISLVNDGPVTIFMDSKNKE